MKIYVSFILTAVLITITSCKFNKNNNLSKNNDYNKIISLYPKELNPIFPNIENIKNDFSSYINYSSEFSPLQLIIEQKEDKKQINHLKSISKLIDKSDTTFYIVNKFLRNNNMSKVNRYKNKIQPFKSTAIPIPNFCDLDDFDEIAINLLNNDYIMFSLESKAGTCCNKKLHRENWNMPIEWENGYSLGYAINNKTNKVIYWAVIW